MDKKLIARFGALVERAFSRKLESIADQTDYNDKYQKSFKAEYDGAMKVVLSVKAGDTLTVLMSRYLELYAQYAANRNEVRFYRSDQLFQCLIEQTGKVTDDEGLFERWAAFIVGDPSTDQFNSFKKRFVDLDAYFRNQINKFIHDEREKRRARRSVLDVLRDEFFKQHQRAASSYDELRDFDPRATSGNAAFEGHVAAVRKEWEVVGSNYTKEQAELVHKALDRFGTYLRAAGRAKLLPLFQWVRMLRLRFEQKPEVKVDSVTGEKKTFFPPPLDEREDVFYRAMYTFACIQLLSAAQSEKIYTKNRLGFTAEEVRFFGEPVEKRFTFGSNLIKVLTPPFKGPGVALGEVEDLLVTYILTKNQLAGMDLVPLDKTLEIQEKWRAVDDITDLIRLASQNNDAKRLEEIFKDPKHEKAIGYLQEISSTTITAKNPWELGKGTFAAGSRIGSNSRHGDIAIVYIDPSKLDRAYVELSTLRPHLFLVQQSFIDNKVMGERILEIYRSTIGVVHLAELMFLAMGFMPVLIEAGFAGLIYEIAVFYASSKIEEQAEKINPTFAKVLGLLLQTFAPRPRFKPSVVSGAVEKADRSALSDVLNKSVVDRGTAKPVAAESRAIGHITEAETDAFIANIRIEQDVLEANMGVTPRNVRDAMEKLKPGYSRFPREWRLKISESEPLRKMINAAEDVKLVRITEKQQKALPYKYQISSMGSDYELHLTVNGQEYRLDGIITDGQGKSWIGESKFTFKDAFDEAYASLHLEGKANPTTSFHYRFLDEKVLPQFRRYANLAKKFGFEGVAVKSNTEFLWATFEQTTRSMKRIEIFFEEFEYVATKAAAKPGKTSRATAR